MVEEVHEVQGAVQVEEERLEDEGVLEEEEEVVGVHLGEAEVRVEDRADAFDIIKQNGVWFRGCICHHYGAFRKIEIHFSQSPICQLFVNIGIVSSYCSGTQCLARMAAWTCIAASIGLLL